MDTDKYAKIVRLVSRILEKMLGLISLTDEDLDWAIKNPTVVIQLIVGAIQNRNPLSVTPLHMRHTWVPWKTVRLGGVSKEELDNNVHPLCTTEGRNLLFGGDYWVSGVESQVGLIVLTPRDLGFACAPRVDEFMTVDFCRAWSEKYLFGYNCSINLCPPEVALKLVLCLQHEPPPERVTMWIASERIVERPDGFHALFTVFNYDGRPFLLSSQYVLENREIGLDDRIIFCLRSTRDSES